jgi:hypothetical protein
LLLAKPWVDQVNPEAGLKSLQDLCRASAEKATGGQRAKIPDDCR